MVLLSSHYFVYPPLWFFFTIFMLFFSFLIMKTPPRENCLPWVLFYTQLLKNICYFSFILLICDGFPWQYLLSDIDLLFLVNIWQLRGFLLFLFFCCCCCWLNWNLDKWRKKTVIRLSLCSFSEIWSSVLEIN